MTELSQLATLIVAFSALFFVGVHMGRRLLHGVAKKDLRLTCKTENGEKINGGKHNLPPFAFVDTGLTPTP